MSRKLLEKTSFLIGTFSMMVLITVLFLVPPEVLDQHNSVLSIILMVSALTTIIVLSVNLYLHDTKFPAVNRNFYKKTFQLFIIALIISIIRPWKLDYGNLYTIDTLLMAIMWIYWIYCATIMWRTYHLKISESTSLETPTSS